MNGQQEERAEESFRFRVITWLAVSNVSSVDGSRDKGLNKRKHGYQEYCMNGQQEQRAVESYRF